MQPWVSEIVIFSTLVLCGCGVKLGNSSIHDGKPIGSVVTSAAITSVQSGKTVSGLTEVYQLDETSEYIVRLSSLSSPSDLLLNVVLVSNGVEANTWSLRAHSGEQNYSTGLFANGGARTFEEVKIQSTGGSPTIYGLSTF